MSLTNNDVKNLIVEMQKVFASKQDLSNLLTTDDLLKNNKILQQNWKSDIAFNNSILQQNWKADIISNNRVLQQNWKSDFQEILQQNNKEIALMMQSVLTAQERVFVTREEFNQVKQTVGVLKQKASIK